MKDVLVSTSRSDSSSMSPTDEHDHQHVPAPTTTEDTSILRRPAALLLPNPCWPRRGHAAEILVDLQQINGLGTSLSPLEPNLRQLSPDILAMMLMMIMRYPALLLLVSSTISSPALPAQVAAAAAASVAPTSMTRPRPFDVLFGRGKIHGDHPGNRRLHLIVDVFRPSYEHPATTRVRRAALTRTVVRIIQQCGVHRARFLKVVSIVGAHNNNTRSSHRIHHPLENHAAEHVWMEVNDKFAHEKVSHLFRDRRKRPLLEHLVDPPPLISPGIQEYFHGSPADSSQLTQDDAATILEIFPLSAEVPEAEPLAENLVEKL